MNMNCCRLLFHPDCVGEISSVLVLFPDVHRLAAPRACSLNESHRVARCLINLRRWTPVRALRWICGPHDGESCCNMKPGSRRSHISLLQWRLRRPQPVVIWVYSALCARSSCSQRRFLFCSWTSSCLRGGHRSAFVSKCVCVCELLLSSRWFRWQTGQAPWGKHTWRVFGRAPWSSVNMKFRSLLLWQQEVWMIVACGAISLSLSPSPSIVS